MPRIRYGAALVPADYSGAYKTLVDGTAGYQTFTGETGQYFHNIRPTSDPNPANWTWTTADAVAAIAQAQALPLRWSHLAWYSTLPTWLTTGVTTAAGAQLELDRFIDGCMARYGAVCTTWNVVNECVSTSSAAFRTPSYWYDTIGEGYIAAAFRRARAASATARLLIVDYSTDEINTKSTFLYDLCVSLLDAGVPLDGVGFQAHIDGRTTYNWGSIAENLQRFADLGLVIVIAEIDVRVGTTPTAADLIRQRSHWLNYAAIARAIGAVVEFTTWGVGDDDSWLPGEQALLYATGYVAKAFQPDVVRLLAGSDVRGSA
jgi:endo-1,4-beta-xylanase